MGAELRNARERLGWMLPDVAAGLRIRLSYLEALEAGRLGDLPAPAYVYGFLRAYAAALGLDADGTVRRFKASRSGMSSRIELAFPAPLPERGLPAGAAVLLAVVLAVGVYAGWYQLSGEGKLPAEAVQPVPERLASLAEQAIPPTPPPLEHAQESASAAVPPAGPMPLDMPSVPPTSAAAAAMPTLQPSPFAAAAAPASSQAGVDGRIVLRARTDSWLQVRERGGPVLLNRVLHAGESWPVPARPNLVLSTGNAGGTELVIDGVIAPPLGGAGAVRRDLPLDPDVIRDGKLPAQVQAASGPAQPAAPHPQLQ